MFSRERVLYANVVWMPAMMLIALPVATAVAVDIFTGNCKSGFVSFERLGLEISRAYSQFLVPLISARILF